MWAMARGAVVSVVVNRTVSCARRGDGQESHERKDFGEAPVGFIAVAEGEQQYEQSDNYDWGDDGECIHGSNEGFWLGIVFEGFLEPDARGLVKHDHAFGVRESGHGDAAVFAQEGDRPLDGGGIEDTAV